MSELNLLELFWQGFLGFFTLMWTVISSMFTVFSQTPLGVIFLFLLFGIPMMKIAKSFWDWLTSGITKL